MVPPTVPPVPLPRPNPNPGPLPPPGVPPVPLPRPVPPVRPVPVPVPVPVPQPQPQPQPAPPPGSEGTPVPPRLTPPPQPKDKFTELRSALKSLAEARVELTAIPDPLSKYRDGAVIAIDNATDSIRTVLDAWAAPADDAAEATVVDSVTQPAAPRAETMPRVRSAIKNLQTARKAIIDSKAGFGKYRDNATRDIAYAVQQLETVVNLNKGP